MHKKRTEKNKGVYSPVGRKDFCGSRSALLQQVTTITKTPFFTPEVESKKNNLSVHQMIGMLAI